MDTLRSNRLMIILIGIAAAVAALILFVYLPFRNDRRAARQRLARLNPQVAQTACGPIEYVTHGEGDPVLVAHGIFGGFDQGLVLARGQLGESVRAIVPSRFGYLGTPMPTNASPAAQADAFACLLDALEIEEAAVLGTSAGGTAAIQFALRHPERCTALLLISSNAPGDVEVGLPPRPLANVLFRSDFAFWLLTTHFPSQLNSIMGVPQGYEMDAAAAEDMAAVRETLLPVSPRAEGALFDMYVSNPDINRGYPLDEIQVPTLIVHAVDDPLAAYANARAMAETIPTAELMTLESGGHPLLGHEARVREALVGFVREKAAASAAPVAEATG